MSDSYSDQLVLALRLRDVPGPRIGQIVAEVEAYTADSGQDPVEAFGPVETYSDDIAAQLQRGSPARLRIGGLLWGYPPAVGSVALVDGLWGASRGGPAEISVGETVFVILLPLAAVLLLTALTRTRRWAYVGAAAIVLAGTGLSWAGNGLVLVRYPAWIGVVCGAVLFVGGLCLVAIVSRDPVIDPRTNRDRHPLTMPSGCH